MSVRLWTKSCCGFECRYGHTSYSSKRFWRRLRLEQCIWCLPFLCFVFICRFISSQLLLIQFRPLIFLSWEVKGLMNTWKHGGLKSNPFDVVYNFSKWASLCIGIWGHVALCWRETVQYSAQSTSNCIFSN